MVFTGMAISPGMDAAWPFLLDVFGGRQSARSVHFIVAWALFAFFVLHIVLVLLNKPAKHVARWSPEGGSMKRRSVLAGMAALFTAGCSKIGDSQAFAGWSTAPRSSTAARSG
jgi:hypothetical protein